MSAEKRWVSTDPTACLLLSLDARELADAPYSQQRRGQRHTTRHQKKEKKSWDRFRLSDLKLLKLHRAAVPSQRLVGPLRCPLLQAQAGTRLLSDQLIHKGSQGIIGEAPEAQVPCSFQENLLGLCSSPILPATEKLLSLLPFVILEHHVANLPQLLCSFLAKPQCKQVAAVHCSAAEQTDVRKQGALKVKAFEETGRSSSGSTGPFPSPSASSMGVACA